MSATTSPPGSSVSLVCGILSIVLCWIPVAGLALGIVAIVVAIRGKTRMEASPDVYTPGGVRVGGFVCGIIGTCFSGLYTIWWLLFTIIFANFMSAASSFGHASHLPKGSASVSSMFGTSSQTAIDASTPRIDAETVVNAYIANELAADGIYKGKTFVVSGQVGDIGKDLMDQAYVTIKSSDPFRTVQCFLRDTSEEAKAKNMNKGDPIQVYGEIQGLMMNVILKNAEIQTIKPEESIPTSSVPIPSSNHTSTEVTGAPTHPAADDAKPVDPAEEALRLQRIQEQEKVREQEAAERQKQIQQERAAKMAAEAAAREDGPSGIRVGRRSRIEV